MIAGGYMAASKIFNINQRAGEYLDGKISQFLGGEFNASSVFILPWSISFKNARLQLTNVPVKIEIKTVRIGFNPFEFIKNRFQPIYGTEQIYLDRPEIIWLLNENNENKEPLDLEILNKISAENVPHLRVNIKKGLIVLSRKGEQIRLAEDLTGWLDGKNSPGIFINIEGKLLADKINTLCKGVYHRDTNSFQIDITGKKCNFAQENAHILTGDIHPRSGYIDGNIHVERINGKSSLSGKFSIYDGSFDLEGHDIGINDVDVSGSINSEEIVFDTITGTVWDISPEMSGSLRIAPELSLKLILNANNIELSKVLSDIYPNKKFYPEGKVNLKAIIEGPLKNLQTIAELSSQQLIYKCNSLHNCSFRLNLDSEKVTINNFNAIYNNYALRVQGINTFNANTPENQFSLTLNIRNQIDKRHDYSIQLRGKVNPANDLYNSTFTLKRNVAELKGLYDFNGNFIFNKGDLKFKMENEFAGFEGSANHLFENPVFDFNMNCTQLPIMKYIGNNNIDILIDGTGKFHGSGTESSFDGELYVIAGEHLTSRCTGRAYFENILKSSRRFDVKADLYDFRFWYSHPMTFNLYAKYDSTKVSGKIIDTDGAELTLNVSRDDGNLDGNLNLNEFPLERIIDIAKRESFSHHAKLTGNAELGGNIRKPFFRTPQPIIATDLIIGGLDRLSGTVMINGNSEALSFSDIHVKRYDIPIIDGQGTWENGSPFVLDLSGKNIKLEAIEDIITKSRRIDGATDYHVTMVFKQSSGTIDGDFKVKNGHFLDIPFDEAKGILGGGSDGFTVNDFTIFENNLYTGNGNASSGYLWKDKGESSGLKMNLVFHGELLKTLPHLTNAIKDASGQGQLNVEVGGTWQDPEILDGELYITKGKLVPAFLVDEVTDITAIMQIDPYFETPSKYKAARIRIGTAKVKGKRLIVNNIHIGDDGWDTIKRPELLTVVNHESKLDFGVLTGKLESIGDDNRYIDLHIPGFMKPKETGEFEISGNAGNAFFVGAAEHEDGLTPYIAANILARSGDFTYPLYQETSSSDTSDFLWDIYWDVVINAGSSAYYVNEITRDIGGVFSTVVSRTESKFDENSIFKVIGRLSDGSFRVTGDARSTSGTVSYFGTEFDVERVEFDLDTERDGTPSILNGRGRTVVQDSTGVSTEIYLNVSTVDSRTNQRRPLAGRVEFTEDPLYQYGARRTFEVQGLGTLEIEFTSTDPSDNTEEKILAKLGVSSEDFGSTAARALTSGFDSYYTKQWLRPFEDVIKKYTKLDVIRVTPSVIGNIVRSQLGYHDRYFQESDYAFFDESRIMLGEYLYKDWFMSYRAQYGLSRNFLNLRERGFFHEIGLQYNLQRNTRLQLKYQYDEVINEGEKRFEIRHDFSF